MLQNIYRKNLDLPLILLSIIPFSIILGPSISLINVLLISLFFCFYCFNKNLIFHDKKIIILFSIFYLYLIFNSLISLDISSGFFRNFGFLRFILFFFLINYFFYNSQKINSLFKTWSIVFFIILIDIYIERLTGSNILGFGKIEIDGVVQPNGERVVSFFINEPIAGTFISGFAFIICGYIFTIFRNNNKYKPLSLIIPALILTGILLTGERSNTIKSFSGIFLFIILIDYIKIRNKIFLVLFCLITFFVTINFSDYVKKRYYGQIYKPIINKEIRDWYLNKNLYLKLYRSGISVFKNYPLFGVGNKNYRVETCDSSKNKINQDYICLTHPHQIYIEMLSEHGIFGTAIILSIFFYLIFRILKKIIHSQNYIQIGAFVYVLINFLPFLPTGSFFSDFNLTLFMINFSLMYAVNKKTNVFFKN